MPTHICYLYIYKYRNLKSVELSLDSHYTYSYNEKEDTLTIEPQDKLPNDFWGSGIYSLTGIFGDNGAGKSTSIRFLLNAVVEGIGGREVDGIVVYECDGQLYIYQNDDDNKSRKLKVSFPSGCLPLPFGKPRVVANLPTINTFYYSGHFAPEVSYDDLLSVELSGYYNGSISYKMRSDVSKFANTIDSHLTFPISTHLVAHMSQNNYRICNLLINERLRSKIEGFKFPRYICIAPNRGGQDHFRFHATVNKELKESVSDMLVEPVGKTFVDGKNTTIARFIHYCLLNALAENLNFANASKIIHEWYAYLDTQQEVMPQFHKFIEGRTGDESIGLKNIDYVLSYLYKVVRTDSTGFYTTFYFDIYQDKEVIKELMDIVLKNPTFLTSRYFDMYYSHNTNDGTSLSSGEQEMLNLFSLILDAIESEPSKWGNLKSPQLIILDEAEIGFHPGWQRNFVKTLLAFLKALMVKPGVDFQVILTSHSPILLSDIPSCCCNYLRVCNDFQTENILMTQQETFSSNIFELYRNPFFLKEGLIGGFAEQKLQELERKIKAGEDGVAKLISLIGDKRLRMYFEDLLFKVTGQNKSEKDKLIQTYKERIKQLEEFDHE